MRRGSRMWLAVLAMIGLGCGRSDAMLTLDELDPGTESSSGAMSGLGSTGGRETTPATSGFDSGAAESGVLDSGPFTSGMDEGPGTTSTSTSTSTTDGTSTSTSTTDGTSTSTSTTDGTSTSTTTGASSGGDDMGSATSGGSTDGGSTGGGTTDGGSTGGGSTGGGSTTGDDYTCADASDCVLACGGPSWSCGNACDDGLSPADDNAFDDFQGCIILACLFNGSCLGGPGSPACIACRVGGLVDPMTVGCEDEAAVCLGA